MITCRLCEQDKPVEDFAVDPKFKKTGRNSRCKVCVNRMAAVSREKRRSLDREATRQLDWQRNLMRVYKLTPEMWHAMYEKQGGVCMYCCKAETEKYATTGATKRLAVDHNRDCCPDYKSCGKCIRGLACSFCNKLMGVIERNPFLIEKMLRMKGWDEFK